ncbi:UNVERIFIED_CONTAM: hypothetical protein RKD50_004274 [Streptomyces canus]
MSVEPFRSVLAGIGLDPTPREVAEILWLATRLPAAPTPAAEDLRAAGPTQAVAEEAGDTVQALPDERAAPDATPAVPVYAPATATSPGGAFPQSARPARLAADPLLPRQLELLRALRPLKRRVPSRHAGEFDEEATLESMAQRSVPRRKAIPLPVLRPASERWLDAVLVVDGHPTGLLLWTPLAREVHRLLIQLGAFRDVRLRYLHSRPDGPAGLSADPSPSQDRIRSTSEIHDPSGRRLVLVLTDGVAPGWQNPSVREAMRQWGAAGPLVVLQALPERLWRRTALPAVPARLRRAPFSAANTDLAYSGRRRGTRELPAGSVPVPVLELSPDWLKPWAGLVAGSGAKVTDTAVTLLAARPQPPQAAADVRPPTRRLKDFHATATPEAFRLLACLSAVPLTVAIMRVVQAAMLPGTPPTVLAEVMFSGLIAPATTDGSTAPADIPHDFLPGVRAALLQSLRAHDVDQVLREVSGFVERRGAVAGRVSGLLPDPGGAERAAEGIPWALLREEALVRAGLVTPAQRVPAPARGNAGLGVRGAPNPYRVTGLITTADFSDVYLAADAEGNLAVVKKQPRGAALEPEASQAFLRVEAEALRRMAGRYAPPLLGVDGEASPTWLAMGHIASISGSPAHNLIHVPWSSNGPADDFHALSQLARELAEALCRAHTAGIVHGNFSPHAVLVVPDTVVLISWVYAQFDGRPHPCPQHRPRATGPLPPEGYPRDEPLDASFDMYMLGETLLREATRGGYFSPPPDALWRLPSHLGGLRALIGRCLDTDPRRRPTARQFLDELEGLTRSHEAGQGETADRRGRRERLEAPRPTSSPSVLLADVDDGVGLAHIRAVLEDLEGRLREDPSLNEGPPPHLVFTGPPGTGKSTLARFVGRLLHNRGLLRRGHCVEVTAADLVAPYVGQTASRVRQAAHSALDGVLFVNDVHGLGEPTEGGFAAEAVDTLMREMENWRGRLCMIVAGDPGRTDVFLAANPGLSSRFGTRVRFPPYDTADLVEILRRMASEENATLAPGVPARAAAWLDATRRAAPSDFGNARTVRRLLDLMKTSMATRHHHDTSPGPSPAEFLPRDVPEPPSTLPAGWTIPG